MLDERHRSEAVGIRDRTRAQTLLIDACWRFIDPPSVLADQDVTGDVDARLERVSGGRDRSLNASKVCTKHMTNDKICYLSYHQFGQLTIRSRSRFPELNY